MVEVTRLGPRPDQASLPPEERLLLALAKLDPTSGDIRRAGEALCDRRFSWRRALVLAVRHGVEAHLLARIDDLRELGARIPGDVRRELEGNRLAGAARSGAYLLALESVLAGLLARGVPVLLLKGAALALTLYPAGARPLFDADILVRPGDYATVAARLEEHGFRKRPPAVPTGPAVRRVQHAMGFVKAFGRETLEVDLHWRQYPPRFPFALRTEALLDRARPVRLGETPALAASAEDTVVHLGTQVVVDLYARYRRVVDVAALVRKGLDPELLAAAALEARAAGATYFALRLAAVAGAQAPDAVLRRLERACPGCRTAADVLADPAFFFGGIALRVGAGVLLRALLCERPRDRRRIVLARAFPLRGGPASREDVSRAGTTAVERIRAIPGRIWRLAGSVLLLAGLFAAHRLGRDRLAAWLRAPSSPGDGPRALETA